MKTFLFSFFCLLWTFSVNAEVAATVEYTTVNEGQVLELRISSDTKKSGVPDLTALKESFDVLGQSSSSSYQNINGKTSASYDFILNVLPKKTGVVLVPEMTWGGETTKPFEIRVEKATSLAQTENEDSVSITGEVLEKQVYENAALTYRATALSRRGLIDAGFIAPTMKDAEVIPLGTIQIGQVTKNGIAFQTLTQDYAIFPAQSGKKLLLTGAGFQGVFLKRKSYKRDLLEPFGIDDPLIYAPLNSTRQEVLVRAENVKIDVLARPDSWGKKWWLPAKNVTLSEKFETELVDLKVGDSITRNVEIKAIGALGTQLPDMNVPTTTDFKVYTQTPQKNSGYEPSLGLVGSLTQSFVFVPLRSGSLTLPPMTVNWFDTATNTEKQAILPQQQINVLPSAQADTEVPVVDVVSSGVPEALQNPYAKENSWLYFVGGLCVGLVFGLICFVLLRHRRHKKKLPDLYPKA